MPSYTRMAKPYGYYYMFDPLNPKQKALNPKICMNRNDPNCIDYTYPGIDPIYHPKESGFHLLSDIFGFYFKKGDIQRVRTINITKGPGSYRTTLVGPMQWDTAARWYYTAEEMQKLGLGEQLTLADIYSIIDDTVHVLDEHKVEIV